MNWKKRTWPPMGRSLTRLPGLLLAAVLCLLALAACDKSTQPTPTTTPPVPSPTATPGNFSNMPLDLEDMISDSSAIVVGTIIGELEPSLVPRQTPGSMPSSVVERFRNLIIGIQESYVPGLQPGQTITVRVPDGLQRVQASANATPSADLPGLGVDERALLFLYQVDKKTQQLDSYAAPDDAPADSYYALMPTRTDTVEGVVRVGHFVPDDDAWLDLETGTRVGQPQLEELIVEHAHVVRPDCLGFWTLGSFGSADSIDDLLEDADLVIKGRVSDDVEVDSTILTVEVLDVLLGDPGADQITVDVKTMHYIPGFAPCDYYFLLRKLDYGQRMDVYGYVGGGAQGVLAVHAGIVEQVYGWIEGDPYRGMSEEDFKNAVLQSAEQIEWGS